MNDDAFDESIEPAVPVSEVEDCGTGAKMSSEEIRRVYIDHETSIKSVSYLYYLGSVFVVIMAVTSAIVNKGEKPLMDRISTAMLMSGIAVFQAWVGMELRTLKRWARVAAGILSGIGLLSIPIGTIINGYILYLLFGKKGAEVFSPGYQMVIAETPGVKGKTSVMVWVVMGLMVLLCIIGILVVIFVKQPVR